MIIRNIPSAALVAAAMGIHININDKIVLGEQNPGAVTICPPPSRGEVQKAVNQWNSKYECLKSQLEAAARGEGEGRPGSVSSYYPSQWAALFRSASNVISKLYQYPSETKNVHWNDILTSMKELWDGYPQYLKTVYSDWNEAWDVDRLVEIRVPSEPVRNLHNRLLNRGLI